MWRIRLREVWVGGEKCVCALMMNTYETRLQRYVPLELWMTVDGTDMRSYYHDDEPLLCDWY